MTHEDKDLLMKDLCARLPYGVKVNVTYSNENASSFRQRVCTEGVNVLNTDIIGLYQRNEIDIKPYLFPLSSMTGEQREELKREYCNIACDNIKKMFANPDESHLYSSKSSSFEIDYFNKHHIDYRGLIPMGLANDATGLNIY